MFKNLQDFWLRAFVKRVSKRLLITPVLKNGKTPIWLAKLLNILLESGYIIKAPQSIVTQLLYNKMYIYIYILLTIK